MFRRSGSSSHIPVPKNLFNADSGTSGRKRSASMARLSQRSSTASSLKPVRRSSVDSKTSTGRLSRQNSPSRLSKLTPQNPPKRGRTNSVQKFTPSDQKGQRNSKVGSGSAIKSVDRKTIQKLSTDATWVSRQYLKVKDFIINSGLFDTTIVTESNIKPPSIKVFIYVTSVLFKELFANVKMTNENYKEVITEKLKVLNYPGTIANSVLKTVNTMHVWPQVIGMFGWLIDKINLRQETPINLETLEPFTRDCYQITKFSKLYLMERYFIFNDGSNEERILKSNQEYVDNLKDILQVDPEKYEQLKGDIERNKEYSSKQDVDVNNLSEEVTKLQKENEKLKEEVDRFKERDATVDKELDDELQLLKAKLEKIKNKKSSLATRIKSLQESIETQPCTYQEKKNLLKTIDTLRDDVRLKKENLEHAQKLQLEFEGTLSDERMRLQSKVRQWNNFLMKWTIKKPQLKPLLLKENGIHQQSYLTIIKEVLKHKVTIEQAFAQELQELGTKMERERSLNSNLVLEVEELIKTVNDLTVEYKGKHKDVEDLEEKLRNLKAEWELKKKTFDQELKELSENNEVENLKHEASALKTKKETLSKELQKFAQKTLAFFCDLRLQISKDLRQMEEIRDKVVENRLTSEIDKQEAMIEKLKSLNTKDE